MAAFSQAAVSCEEKQQFPDGCLRVRNMLLAEKKEPRDSGGLLSTIHRAINEELGVPLEDLRKEGVMQYRQGLGRQRNVKKSTRNRCEMD